MIAGHLGVAAILARSRTKPLDNVHMVAFATAAFLPDIVDLAFALGDVCNPYGLFSHTLPILVLLAAIAAGAVALLTGIRSDALMIGAIVLLHAPGDFITGRKLFWPGGELFGWRFYDRPWVDLALEVALATCGWWLLRRARWAPRWTTSIPALLALLATQAGLNIVAAQRDSSLKPIACSVSVSALTDTSLRSLPHSRLAARRDAALVVISLTQELADRRH